MNVRVLCVGALREKWQKDACAEYLTRLARYGKYELTEVPDEPEDLKNVEKALLVEGQALLKRIKPSDYVIALCVDAKQLSSEEFAARCAGLAVSGKQPALVIGGSNGLSKELLARADERLSFSRLTFPHQLMRVILLEQLYRAEKINAGERYHK